MYILGIDPGLDGGLVLIDKKGDVIAKHIMPIISMVKKAKNKSGKKTVRSVDIVGVNKLIEIAQKGYGSDLKCYMEKVHAMPKQGVCAMFNFGYAFGVVEACLVANKIPYELVTPQAWCKVMHQGISKEYQAKDRSLLVFKRLYPNFNFKATERCKRPHDGLVDGLLIAEYGRRQNEI